MRCFQQFFVFSILFVLTLSVDERIVGGRLAQPGEFPFQVSIRRSYNDNHFCGGSLISRKHILTAAHCMFYSWGGVLSPTIVKIFMGQTSLAVNSSSISRNASEIFIHPDYDSKTMANDVAIIELNKEVIFDVKFINRIFLNNGNSFQNIECTVSGWGVTKFGSMVLSDNLLATDVTVISSKDCQRRYDVADINLQKGMLCAVNDYRQADACQGDSGGPLVCKGYLTGIVSTGIECANDSFPGIYTDVSYFFPWISKTIGSEYMEQNQKEKEISRSPLILRVIIGFTFVINFIKDLFWNS